MLVSLNKSVRAGHNSRGINTAWIDINVWYYQVQLKSHQITEKRPNRFINSLYSKRITGLFHLEKDKPASAENRHCQLSG